MKKKINISHCCVCIKLDKLKAFKTVLEESIKLFVNPTEFIKSFLKNIKSQFSQQLMAYMVPISNSGQLAILMEKHDAFIFLLHTQQRLFRPGTCRNTGSGSKVACEASGPRSTPTSGTYFR